MNPNPEMPDVVEHQPGCYRPGRQCLVLGVVGTILFFGAGVLCVSAAYWNVDGSFPHPMLHALIYGVFFSVWTLNALLLMVFYFRGRLFVNTDAIVQYGCIARKKINVSDVIQIVWKGTPHAGKVIVRSHLTTINIDFENYTSGQRNALMEYFHDTFPIGIQDGWLRFAEFRQTATKPTLADSLKFALMCAMLLLGFGAIFIYCWASGLGVQWLVIGIVNSLAGLFYLVRCFRLGKRASDKTSTEQDLEAELPNTGL